MKFFTSLTDRIAHWAGSPFAVIGSILLTLLWFVSGPLFGWSDTWQLVANTGTTLVTFILVFVIQSTQNRQEHAIQAKLDELIRSSNARNELIGIDQKSEKEIEEARHE